MKMSGPKHPELLIVGEAPGEEEDDAGEPFVGKSGQLLRNVLGEIGYDLKAVSFTNVVRCRPPENKITKRYIDLCSQFAVRDIEASGAKLVFLLGNSPLQGVLHETGITSWNGVLIKKGDVTYVPLYHPAYILRDMTRMSEWLNAMLDATEGDTKQSDSYELSYPQTVTDVLAMAEDLRQYKYISFDTEVQSLNPFTERSLLLAVSFARPGVAYSLPVDHPEAWWDISNANHRHANDHDVIVQEIINILQEHSGHLIGHNVKFDQMQAYGLLGDLEIDAAGDSMIISHLLDSRSGIHGLKRLAGLNLGMYEYDRELKAYVAAHKEANFDRGGSYAKVPLDILLPYSAKDAEATLKLHGLLYERLSKKQKVLYKQMIMPLSNSLTRMQCTGMAVDYYVANRYDLIYRNIQRGVLNSICADKYVKKIVKKDGKAFNPNSSLQTGKLLYKYYKAPITVKTKGGAPSTSADVLNVLKADYPIAEDIRYYKLLTKMVGTYLHPCATGVWSSDDGKVRTTYNIHGTVTGRLSSSQPFNAQNIPTPEKEPGTLLEFLPIKNMFTHSYWVSGKSKGVVMSVDQSGMELRVFASVSKCENMIEIIKSGKDTHSCVAIMSMTHKPVEDISFEEIAALDKAVRYRYKWTNWTLLYGGDEYTLSNLYSIPIDEAKETVRMYYELFPEVLDYKDWCAEFASTHGYIESPFGRREYLPYINDADNGKRNRSIREAVNMPVQSAASDTVLSALIIIDDKLRRAGYMSRLVNTVHDSVVLDVPEHEIAPTALLCKDVMENVAVYAKEYMPKVDFSWLLCPLKADVEIGSHYGSEEAYNE